jgi:hypothetical protein
MNARRSSVGPLLLLAIAALHCAQPASTRAAGQSSDGGADVAIVVPLCEVVSNPAAYDGKRVTVNGCVTTDGREYVALSNIEKTVQ